MEIGAQLYTVREHTKTLEDFSRTLEKIAAIGYRNVQVSGTCAYEPAWLKAELDRTGLRCVLTHTDPGRIAAETDAVAAEHQAFGCTHIGIGSLPGGFDKGLAGYQPFAETYRPVGRRLAALGCRLMYHNHHMEFARTGEGREIYLERFLRDFAPEELGFTLDTYWVQAGGGDPVQWLNRLAGRVPCVHLKDMAFADGQPRMAPVYEGNMNFDGILKACEQAGARYLLVEQDDCYGADPFECLAMSYRNLAAKVSDD